MRREERNSMSDTQEIVQRLEHEIAQRAAAVEKVDAFKAQFNRAIKAFMAADEAVRGLNDHDSEVDTQIATARSTRPLRGHGSKVEEGRTKQFPDNWRPARHFGSTLFDFAE